MDRDWRDERIDELTARLAARDARIAALEKQIAELEERLGQSSHNSHLPPSTDPPDARKWRKKRRDKGAKKPKKKRGGQPGHRGAHRELAPTDKVSKFVDHYPEECGNCWKSLPKVHDVDAARYQVIELPPIEPHITEHRRHEVSCPGCGFKTRAAFDEEQMPASPFGPRLMALIAVSTGVYNLSRRKAAQLLSDVAGVQISLGAVSTTEARVSEAVEPAVDEAWQQVTEAEVKHTDGTSWLQSGFPLSLWTIATTAATVFKIVADSSKKTLEPLFDALTGILVSDRAKALNFWAMERRQICWAHLVRKFVAFSERDGPAGDLGRELLGYAGVLFEYWHDYQAGKLSRERFVAWMVPVRAQIEAALRHGQALNVRRISGSCADILAHEQALWTFVDHDDVPPTNNHAEQEIRAFVLWRKRSFGTQSQRGNLFAERLMTIAHTARKQDRNVLGFVTACCEAQARGLPRPSLFGSVAAAVA